jgi:hypothetical protein
MVRTQALEVIMGMCQSIGTASDRVMAMLMAGLEIEFGRGAGEALAHRFLEAEETDFLWDARIEERWLGSYESIDDDDLELDRIAICGRLDGARDDGKALLSVPQIGTRSDGRCALIAHCSTGRGGVGLALLLPLF